MADNGDDYIELSELPKQEVYQRGFREKAKHAEYKTKQWVSNKKVVLKERLAQAKESWKKGAPGRKKAFANFQNNLAKMQKTSTKGKRSRSPDFLGGGGDMMFGSAPGYSKKSMGRRRRDDDGMMFGGSLFGPEPRRGKTRREPGMNFDLMGMSGSRGKKGKRNNGGFW